MAATGRHRRHGTLHVCHIDHPNDRVYAENLSEFFAASGVAHRTIEFDRIDPRALLAAVADDTLGVIGFNWELDHAWIDSKNFLDIARARGIPVVSWMLDHPSAAWPRFTRSYTDQSRFLFLSPYSEAYFRKFAMPSCRSACVVATGANHRSRLGTLRREEFMAREISCMLPLNLKRVGGTIDAAEQRLAALPQRLRTAVRAAIALAQDSLSGPIERHFFDNDPPPELLEQPYLFHHCIQIIEEIVQVRRRLAVFAIASAFPVLIQSDIASTYVHELGAAKLEQNVSMRETIERMQRTRAVVSLTHVNDEIHNRTLNGLNAGAVNIIEDNDVHRRFFTHGKNALLFRYGDDSLRDCLALVCSRPERAFEIAAAGMSLRDDPRLRFGGYQNILEMVKTHCAA